MEATVLKVLWGLILVVLIPLFGWFGKRGIKLQEEKFAEMKVEMKEANAARHQEYELQRKDIETIKDKNYELLGRVIQLESSSVKRDELIELLQTLEKSIESRFDKSFEKLENNFNKILDKIQ